MEKAKDTEGSSSVVHSFPLLEGPTDEAYTASPLSEHWDENNHLYSTVADSFSSHVNSNQDVSVLDHMGSAAEILSKSGTADEEANSILSEVPEISAPYYVDGLEVDVKIQQSDDINTNPFMDAGTIGGYIISMNRAEMETKHPVLTNELQSELEAEDTQYKGKMDVWSTQDKESEVSEKLNKDSLIRGLVDTAAPFESVKQAVSKFGNMTDWKAQKALTLERRMHVELDLEKAQEEIPKYKKQSEDAEFVKRRVLEELDYTKKQIEEIKLNLEKAETEEVQAKQDSELAELRVKEMEQGITNDASVAAKAQLEVAKGRHVNAVLELASVREELEALQREYISLVQERDIATSKAKVSILASKDIEKTVEDLTVKLITTNALLESAHSAHLEAEEQRIGAVLACEQEQVKWEKELKQAEDELEHHNQQLLVTSDLKSKLDTESTLLAGLKAELALYMEAKANQEVMSIDVKKLAGQEGNMNPEDSNIPLKLAMTKKELEEVKANIEKAKDKVNCLRIAAHSLQSELEMEQTSLATLRHREELAPTSFSSLEDELTRTKTELELVVTREKEAREKMAELPKTLQVAAEEVDQAKSVANLAHEELKEAKKEAEQLKAGMSTMEARLNAALKEIEAAKASEKLAISSVNALKESGTASMEHEDSPCRVTLLFEEYDTLSKKAQESEDLANNKVISAVEQIKLVKDSESRSIERLQDANKEMEERRKVLQAAVEKADKAKEGEMVVEEELWKWRAEHEKQGKASHVAEFTACEASSEPKISTRMANPTARYNPLTTISSKFFMSRSNTKGGLSESRLRRRSFIPRILMFLARKKAQSLK